MLFFLGVLSALISLVYLAIGEKVESWTTFSVCRLQLAQLTTLKFAEVLPTVNLVFVYNNTELLEKPVR